jgi:hypothetical protein
LWLACNIFTVIQFEHANVSPPHDGAFSSAHGLMIWLLLVHYLGCNGTQHSCKYKGHIV